MAPVVYWYFPGSPHQESQGEGIPKSISSSTSNLCLPSGLRTSEKIKENLSKSLGMVRAGKAFMLQDSSNQASEGVGPCLLIVLSFLGFTGGPWLRTMQKSKVVPLMQ